MDSDLDTRQIIVLVTFIIGLWQWHIWITPWLQHMSVRWLVLC